MITISDTRTKENDTSGKAIVDLLEQAGHQVLAWEIVTDDPQKIRAQIERMRTLPQIDAVLLTGGTGVGSRDQTFETLSGMPLGQLLGKVRQIGDKAPKPEEK